MFFDIHADPHLVDAVIGLSVAYKAFENLGGFQHPVRRAARSAAAVLGFGLVHGFGLATKLQALNLNPDGLLANLVSVQRGRRDRPGPGRCR